MDPNANLLAILQELSTEEPDRDRITELVEELHYWLDRGGALPACNSLEAGESFEVGPTVARNLTPTIVPGS